MNFLKRLTLNGLEFFGLLYSQYTGVVLDNEVDNIGSIKVYVPIIHKDSSATYVTAIPRNIISGVNADGEPYGAQMLPRVGDFVNIEFRFGNPRFPVWSHGNPQEGTKPSEFTSPDQYGFKSPEGQLVMIDDNNGKVYIISRLIELGDPSKLEQAVKGETLKGKLEELIDAINTITVPTAFGPSGTPINAPQFTAIKNSLDEILSEVNKLE